MAEDSLLLNFSAPSATENAPLPRKAVFKGGRWRDRVRVTKVANGRQQASMAPISAQMSASATTSRSAAASLSLPPPLPTTSTSSPKEGVFKSTDPVTANSRASDDMIASSERENKRRKIDQPKRFQSQVSKDGHEVVSSLFSSNIAPSTTATSTTEANEALSVPPSNAPLLDGPATFTSLGLHAQLATHLHTKLGLGRPTAIQRAALATLLDADADAFIQAETGSGKTLAYLLPIVQRLMALSQPPGTGIESEVPSQTQNQIHRDSGLWAVILAPTRELCRQIAAVLERLLGCARWIVAGTVVGGEKKKSEKARLRKGINVLVATPGRLVDHLAHTEALDVSCVRWLVLDEGDRLVELGFEEDIRAIVTKLEERSRVARYPHEGLPSRRITILCSATMKMNVQRLGEMSLKDAVHVKADDSPSTRQPQETNNEDETTKFTAPTQLKQSYILVPPKQRMVTLAALLKRNFARKGSVMKAMVFISCADSVDFHFSLLARQPASIAPEVITNGTIPTSTSDLPSEISPKDLPTKSTTPLLTSTTNASLSVFKLHGSLPQALRTTTLQTFSRSTSPAILLCTDVASRGLDLPNIDLVIEYDPAFSSDDHLHRIGRTARAGKDGRATIFLMPGPEAGYVDVLKTSYRDGLGRGLVASTAEQILTRGFGAQTEGMNASSKAAKAAVAWEVAATEFQLDAERWVLENSAAAELARKAYISHVRAYATHVLTERAMFDVKALHLGHLAKAFALRDRPGRMGRGMTSDAKSGPRRIGSGGRGGGGAAGAGKRKANDAMEQGEPAAVTAMQHAARKMRKTMERQMGGAGEFNVG